MNYPSRKGELIIGLVALLVVGLALALSMFFTVWAEKQNAPAPEPAITTQVYNTDISASRTLRLVWEEGPGYKRMQTSGRDGMIEWQGESIYAEVK
jgi:hypothetical protein